MVKGLPASPEHARRELTLLQKRRVDKAELAGSVHLLAEPSAGDAAGMDSGKL